MIIPGIKNVDPVLVLFADLFRLQGIQRIQNTFLDQGYMLCLGSACRSIPDPGFFRDQYKDNISGQSQRIFNKENEERVKQQGDKPGNQVKDPLVPSV